MGLYRNVRTRILMNESSCTSEQLAELKSKFAIEARPAEKIRRPAQLIEELEERLVLEPEDDDAHSHNWRVLREIAVILGIDCTDFPEVLAADPLPPPVLPIADLSPRLIEALADTFCRLPEGETKRFLRLLGFDFTKEYKSRVQIPVHLLDSWFSQSGRDRRRILQMGCQCFLENVAEVEAEEMDEDEEGEEEEDDFDLREHIVELVSTRSFFDPPLNQLAKILKNLV